MQEEHGSQRRQSADPRLLVGEPLSLDLVNTRWVDDRAHRDLLDSTEGLAVWLRSAGLDDRAVADQATLDATLETREILRALLAQGPSPQTLDAFNRVLDHGALHYRLGPNGREEHSRTDDPAWFPSWLAAADYLRLMADAPARVKHCAHPDCVLHFFDATKSGTRRWCSMAICGNRAKAARHYERAKTGR
ncbi:CGNR zinc finger domain-containing protein [Actinomadura sp. NAK00032]|uniref:CGNR zinc finger domain-containing protein n=1 Tax=Actinomadura sp. NAK00032 TaxID=2742128 RepID=UPI0015901C60|nr:CGNR zinc finger domain-containing protein [Actinomadura sp. NAK00032]QKW39961.1 CGNR zinc finger domain-containing protein [Actinomadura sp. NAK00032]